MENEVLGKPAMHSICPTHELETAKTILVVEDEAPTRKLIGIILRQAGYAVLEAGDGETAENIYRGNRGKIDLLLTDISLPGATGCELAAHLQESEPHLTVLFMSGTHQPKVAGPFLRKPFGIAELLQRVQVLSGNSSHPQATRRTH
jgi:two-component system cell cycle sensor histidine kinase/response regulator CckA